MAKADKKFVVRSKSGKVVGRYATEAEAKHRIEQLPAAAIRHVLQDPRVHVLAIGMRLKKEVDANLKVFSSDATCTPEDRALLAEFSTRLFETDTVKKFRIE